MWTSTSGRPSGKPPCTCCYFLVRIDESCFTRKLYGDLIMFWQTTEQVRMAPWRGMDPDGALPVYLIVSIDVTFRDQSYNRQKTHSWRFLNLDWFGAWGFSSMLPVGSLWQSLEGALHEVGPLRENSLPSTERFQRPSQTEDRTFHC